jgi:transposase-like protein
MARRGYSPEFRRRVVDLVEGGRKVSEVAAEFEVSEQTIYTWRRQARIDAGLDAERALEGFELRHPADRMSKTCASKVFSSVISGLRSSGTLSPARA